MGRKRASPVWRNVTQTETSARLLKGGVNFFLSAIAAWALSRMLQRLSGAALWLPADWRDLVEIFSTLLGTVAFMRVYPRDREVTSNSAPAQRAFSLIRGGAAHGGSSGPLSHGGGQAPSIGDSTLEVAAESDPNLHHRHELQRAVMWAAAAILILMVAMFLRARCLLHWDMRDWLSHESNVDATRPFGSAQTNPYPDFLDIKSGHIYVPLWFPSEQARYVALVSHSEHRDGLEWMLKNEPDRLIDWLRGPCRTELYVTSAIFFLVHLLIVFCVAKAAGYAFDPAESLVHLIMRGG